MREILRRKGQVTLKCAYPEEFNDPYELFLRVTFKDDPELLAYIAETIGDLPQLPTTCFSKSPAVVPMWAHYGQNSTGFVLIFEESKLAEYFPESGFGDVDYLDEPADDGIHELALM